MRFALRGTDAYDAPSRDCDARWPFPWHDRSVWDLNMLSYFKQAIALRKDHPVLRGGKYQELFARGRCYAFARTDSSESLVIVLNAGDEPVSIELPSQWQDRPAEEVRCLFGEPTSFHLRTGHLALSLPPRSGAVFGLP